MGQSPGTYSEAMRWSPHPAYRATGADLPYGDPLRAHGVAMEGYFWRVTDARRNRSLIVLAGINRGPQGPWATLGFGTWPTAVLALDAHDGAWADPHALGVRVGQSFVATADRVQVDLGPGARLDLRITDPRPWPRGRFGGSSGFQMVPGLNQYWHPWLLGGRAEGTATVDGEEWDLTGAQVYAEKNWGKEGFPDSWWWGQAQGFAEPDACVAFAGGEVTAGPLRTEVTALVVRLPDGTVVRQGNPVLSPVTAEVSDDSWRLSGHSRTAGWRIEVTGSAPLGDAHVLPVPLPSEHRNTAGAIEHLGGRLEVRVSRRGEVVWQGTSAIAGLEHGGLARAEAELRRRGSPPGAVGAPPLGSGPDQDIVSRH